jgi:hypothetical protein
MPLAQEVKNTIAVMTIKDRKILLIVVYGFTVKK